jgi:hypothetical protein
VIIHCCMDVRGWISNYGRATKTERKRMARGIVVDGREATPDEALSAMLDELAAGHLRLPVGWPCEGFSYATGCPGHEKKESTDA